MMSRLPRLEAFGDRAGIVLAVAFLWLIAEFVILGPYSYDYVQDGTDLFLSANMSVPHAGVPDPRWDNFTVAGTNRAALAYTGALYTLLFTHLPVWLAHQIAIVAQFASGLFASYLLARRTFAFGREASVFVAVAYALLLTGSLINSVIAYLPATLLATTALLDRKTSLLRWAAAAAAVFVVADTAYFSRLVPFASVALVAWFLLVDLRSRGQDWLIIAGIAISLAAIRADTILALVAEAPSSHLPLVRTVESAAVVAGMAVDMLTRPVHLAAVIAMVLAIVLEPRRDAQFWRVVVLAGLGYISIPVAQAALPWLSDMLGRDFRGFRLHRFFLIPQTALIFGLGYGVDAIIRRLREPRPTDPASKGWRGVLLGGAICLAAVSVFNKWSAPGYWITQGNLVQNFESPVLSALADRLRAQPWPERAEPFQLYPAHLQAYGIETAGGNQPLIPRRYYEFWSALVEPWLNRPSGQRGVAWWNHDPAILAETAGWPRYRGDRLLLAPDEHSPDVRLADFVRVNLLALANVGYVVSRDRLADEGFALVQGVDRPWSSLTTREKILTNLRANVTGRTHLYIYRNQNVLPRFFSVETARLAESGRAVVDALSAASIETLRRTAFVERSLAPAELSDGDLFAALDLKLDHYSSDEIRLSTTAPARALLIVTNSYSPRWTVEIDGQLQGLFPADHAFWGLIVPAGARSIVFRYR